MGWDNTIDDWDKAKDDEILHRVTTDFNIAKQERAPHEEKWLRYYKLYRSYTEKQNTGANLFIPYTFSIIESVLPRIITAMFAARPFIGVLPMNEATIQNAQNMEQLLDFQTLQRLDLQATAVMWIKEALLYGTSFLKTGWKYEEREVRRRKPPTTIMGIPIGGGGTENVKIVAYDDPTVTHIDLWDLFWDVAGTSVDDSLFGIQRVYRSPGHIKSLARQGIYTKLDKITEQANMNSLDTGMEGRRAALGLGSGKSPNNRKIELLEYWMDDRVVVVANRTAVIRNSPNPYWHGKKPFVRAFDHPVPHEMYGIGEIEPIEFLQYELNDTRNQRMDNVNLVLNRMWKILRGADVDPEQLLSRPGGFIELDDMGDIEELAFTDVTQSSYREEAEIKADIDRTSGVNDYARGESTDRRETATTASILSTAANERFKLKIQLMEDVGLRRLGQQLIQLNQQFVDKTRAIRILGPEGITFTDMEPEDIVGEFDSMPIGSTVDPLVNKEARLNQLINLYSNLQQSPYINHTEFLKKMLETADFKDVDRLLAQAPPAPQPGDTSEVMPGDPTAGVTGMVGGVPTG